MTEKEIWLLLSEELIEYCAARGYYYEQFDYVFSWISPLIRQSRFQEVIDMLGNWHIDLPKSLAVMENEL